MLLTNLNRSNLAVLTVAVMLTGMLTGCIMDKPDETNANPILDRVNVKGEHVEVNTDAHDDDGHHHDEGETYQCDDGKTVMVDVHSHEDDIEAHATIDGITYDLRKDAVANQYISHEDGINNQGMTMLLTGNQAVFTSLADNSVLLTCQK